MSKFMLLIYSDPSGWTDVSDQDQGAIMGEYFGYTQALADAGVLVAGDPLQGIDTAKTVGQNGVVTDGPFADVTEHLGGYYIVDVADQDAAIGWAGKLPGVSRGLDHIEVRPLMELPGGMAP